MFASGAATFERNCTQDNPLPAILTWKSGKTPSPSPASSHTNWNLGYSLEIIYIIIISEKIPGNSEQKFKIYIFIVAKPLEDCFSVQSRNI